MLAAFRGVQFVELAGGLADAQRRGDKPASAQILEQLIRRANEQGEAEARVFYEDLCAKLVLNDLSATVKLWENDRDWAVYGPE